MDKVDNLKKHPIVSHQQKSFYDFTGAADAKKKPTNVYLNIYYLTFVTNFIVVCRLQNNSISAYSRSTIKFVISMATKFLLRIQSNLVIVNTF